LIEGREDHAAESESDRIFFLWEGVLAGGFIERIILVPQDEEEGGSRQDESDEREQEGHNAQSHSAGVFTGMWGW